jgi:hypothetical protein
VVNLSSPDGLLIERDLALKEVYMPGADSRRRLMNRITSLVQEEEAFCATVASIQFDFGPALAIALEQCWPMLAQKALACPISLAAPLMCDAQRLSSQFDNDGKRALSRIIQERLVEPSKEALERYLVDQVSPFFERLKRTQQVFTRKFPAVVDRLWAASRGVKSLNDVAAPIPGILIVTETVLQLLATLPTPFARLENLFLIQKTMEIRSDVTDLHGLELDAQTDALVKECSSILLESTPFGSVLRLAQLSEEDENELTAHRLEDVLLPFQGNGIERAVAQTVSLTEAKVSFPGLKSILLDGTKDQAMEAYWRLAENAAEILGVSVKPSPTAVRDVWAKNNVA